MYVAQLELENFRGIPNLVLDFQKQTNILVGNNGAGKSSILDCLAILLSRMTWRICSTTGTGRFFVDIDITNGISECVTKITLKIKDDYLKWKVTKARRGRKKQTITNLEQVKKIAETIHLQLEDNPNSNVPLAVYYPVNRAVLDIPIRIKTKHEFNQISAYDRALTGGRNDFRIFFEWYRSREDIENEKYRVNKRNYIDIQLQSVRKAIESFLPGFKDLRVQRSPLQMILQKDGEEIVVNQLSDGEKCLLALVGDLARRLAIANPSLDDPLHGEGVVLIDEIDLHLHPTWQRTVVENFERTFPQCQFILTTHSPQILSHVKSESIYLLQRDKKGFRASKPEDSYGRDSNRILEDIMDVPARPLLIKKRLSRLFRLIDEGQIQKAQRAVESIRNDIGDDPELAKADVLIRRKEIIGK